MYYKHTDITTLQVRKMYRVTDITHKTSLQIILTYKTSDRNVQGTDITQNLVLFTHVLLTYFVYSCTVNLFCVDLYSKLVLQTYLTVE